MANPAPIPISRNAQPMSQYGVCARQKSVNRNPAETKP